MSHTTEYQRGYAAARVHGNEPGWEPSTSESKQFWEGYADFMRQDAFFTAPQGANDSLQS